jgi:uncharacterized protein (TIGR04551 family)
MKTSILSRTLFMLLVVGLPASAVAQDSQDPQTGTGDQPATLPSPSERAEEQIQEDEAAEEEDAEEEDAEGQADDGAQDGAQDDQASKKEADSPISDLADKTGGEDFEPVEDIEEEDIQELAPAKVYPFVTWDGMFRVRSAMNINFDLDTGGTSSIRPPTAANFPDHAAANPDAELLAGADMNFRIEPTIHITERLELHVEANLLNNLVLGALPQSRLTSPSSVYPDPSRTVTGANQIPPRELEWFENALRINEAYGAVHTALGSLKAGRMDWDWGLGMYANGGDCADCNFGDHVDRIRYRSPKLFKMYASAAVDFPDQGITSQTPARSDGQAYDMTQIDDARQFTFSIFNKPVTEKDKQLQQKRLKEDRKPVYDGGVLFSYRTQRGSFIPGNAAATGNEDQQAGPESGELVYRGLQLFVPDVWFRFKWEPEPNRLIRVELEANGVFGSVDNTTDESVGDAPGNDDDVNCFNEEARANSDQCTTNSEDIGQFGAALESEFYFGGPVRFGLNSGVATGSDQPNWGYGSSDLGALDSYRFDPNYHVDLIGFREVVGTVTNAVYANPYVQARFFETPDQRLEVQLDAIASRALRAAGTPSGEDNWLGLEFDGAVRYLQLDTFLVELEGGIFFPFGALDAREGRPRLTNPPNSDAPFGSDADANLAWTIQTNLVWEF